MVKLKPGENIDAIARARGAKVVGRNDKMGVYLLEFADDSTTDSALASLKQDPSVASIDYNYIFDAPPSAQQLGDTPANFKQPSLTLNPSTPSDPRSPIVGLIDTGVQPLGGNLDQFMMSGVNVTGDNVNLDGSTPTHGTSMAETILEAASQQGNSGSLRVLPVNIYGNSETATTWNLALGIQAAVDGGATILNMSLAGPNNDPVLNDIVDQALARGVVIYASAGNQPVSTPNYPAAIPGVNAVTALSAPGQLASYANYGSFVELALPGQSVVYIGNQPWVVQGTSPAAAYATGIAAGVRASSGMSWTQIEATLANRFPMPQPGH
jgi:hypothetical protein